MKRILLGTVLLLLAGQPAVAASAFAGEFLALGAGARSLALGNAYVALADDATAGYWNPAGLAHLRKRQIHLMHADRYGGMVSHDYVAFGGAWHDVHGLAVSLVRVGVDDIPYTELEDPGRPLGPANRPIVASTHTSADYALYLSYGRHLHRRLSVGASVKGIYRTVDPYSARGIGLDVGAGLRLHPAIRLAVVVRDLTTTPIVWNTDSTDRIQPSLLTGVSCTSGLAGGQLAVLMAARAGGDAADAGDATPLHAGVEFAYRQIALRAGAQEGRLSLGIGLRPHSRFELDLAYAQHDNLESIQQVSAVIHL